MELWPPERVLLHRIRIDPALEAVLPLLLGGSPRAESIGEGQRLCERLLNLRHGLLPGLFGLFFILLFLKFLLRHLERPRLRPLHFGPLLHSLFFGA